MRSTHSEQQARERETVIAQQRKQTSKSKSASKQASEQQDELATKVAAFFEQLESEHATAQQLADFVERDAKTVRAHLRKIKSRDQSKYKNAQYSINAELFEQVAAHFAKAKRMQAS